VLVDALEHAGSVALMRQTEDIEVAATSDDVDGGLLLPWYFSWWRVGAVAVAATLLVVASVLAITRDPSPGAESVDAGFLQDMRAHHDQAVLLSLIYMGVTDTDPGLHTIAAEVLLSQQLEAGIFVEVLRGLGLPEENSTELAMSWMNSPVPLAAMPGMASQESVDLLKASTGAVADDLFATLMIAHHRGGIGMAEHAQDHAETDRVREIAEAVVRNQTGEIAELEAAVTRSLENG
jgi:uncharacterized protein (DUF305 family)